MLKLKFIDSLEKKIVFFGVILSLLSVILTTATCYFVSSRLILNQYERVNQIATDAAVEKTNTYLGEIAQIISMSMNYESFESLITNEDEDGYSHVKAQKDYETFIKNLIQNNDKVDALILVNKNADTFVTASNAVSKYYTKYKSQDFYKKLEGLTWIGTESQFALDRYTEDKNYERIAVISPVFEPYGNSMQAYMVVVLSGKLSQDLQFAGDGIYISDNFGNSAALIYGINYEEKAAQEFEIKNQLNFHNWTITNTFTFDKIQKSIDRNLQLNIIFGLLSVIISILPMAFISKKIVYPIKNMEEQIDGLNHGIIENKPIVLPKKRTSFKLALLILYSIIVTFPVILITGSSYLSSRSTVENKIGSVFEYSADILYQQMAFIFDNNQKKAIEISTINTEIQTILASQNTTDILTSETKIRYEMNNMILSQNLFDKGISNIAIYDAQENLLYSSSYGRPFMMRAEIKSDLDFVKKHFGTFLWRSQSEESFNTKSIRIGMQIRGAAPDVESGKLLGFLLIDYNSESIEKVLNVFLQHTDVGIYLIDESGRDVLERRGTDDADNLAAIRNYLGSPLNNGRLSFHRDWDNYLMISKKFDKNQWQLIFLLKNFNENRQILLYSVAVLAGLIILSFASSYGFSYIVSFNITSLIKTVRKVKTGDLKVRFKSTSRDELGELGDSFNEMLERLNKMIEEKFTSEVKMKDAQIKAKEYELNLLQAQINPHFLYNTLKTAQYMAFSKDPRTERMIKLLISLFNTGITRGEKMVKVRDEIAHVRTYIDIQQMRFGDKFSVDYDIEDALMDSPILKLTLQPIVENAIYHGLEVTEDGGAIRIEAKSSEGKLKINIRDDGAGMTPERLEEIRGQLDGKIKSKSIGIINVHERIKLYFGNDYGIEVHSEAGKGSDVTIWFPLLESRIP